MSCGLLLVNNMIRISSDIRPLSVNEAWQGRRFKTPRYLGYERDLLLTLPKMEMVHGNVHVELDFFYKRDKVRDLDNGVKPLLDILVKRGYIEDDRYIYELIVRKHKRNKEGVQVFIEKLLN